MDRFKVDSFNRDREIVEILDIPYAKPSTFSVAQVKPYIPSENSPPRSSHKSTCLSNVSIAQTRKMKI